MNKEEALNTLERMSNKEFNLFLKTLPQRVQMLVRSGMTNWKEVLPTWFLQRSIKINK